MPARLAPLSISTLGFFVRKTYTLACNWKVYVDNYLDGGYHVPHLHKALNSVLEYTEYTIENGEHYALQSSPLVASKDASVAHTRTGDRAYYYWLYPNFMINIYQGVMDTNLVVGGATRPPAAPQMVAQGSGSIIHFVSTQWRRLPQLGIGLLCQPNTAKVLLAMRESQCAALSSSLS